MTAFNNQGIRVRDVETGRLLHDSNVSAKSRRRAITHAVTEDVPDAVGLSVRFTVREAARMSDREREQVYAKARKWFLQRVPMVDDPRLRRPEPPVEDSDGESALNDLTLDELRDMARDLDVQGRSGMNKAELVVAIEAVKDE